MHWLCAPCNWCRTQCDNVSLLLAPQLLNGVIERACAAGNPAAAQSAFRHMCRARLAPSAATVAPLLAALRQQHPADEVVELALALAEQADEACGTPGQGLQVRQQKGRRGGTCGWCMHGKCTQSGWQP